MFRVFQEALTNVKRHAAATSVSVTLDHDGGGWRLDVEDDGRGLPHDALDDPASLGIVGMRERARALGGRVSFAGASSKGGTVVTLRLPELGKEQRS